MIHAVKADVVLFLENIVASLQSFAKANFVRLRFESSFQHLEISYHPESLLPSLTQLLCRIITFTPQGGEVVLCIQLQGGNVSIQIIHSGVQLDHLEEITSGLNQPATVRKHGKEGSVFELNLGPIEENSGGPISETIAAAITGQYSIPPFFYRLRESLRAHFTDLHNLEKAADARSAQDGVFLKKVNTVILAHLDQEHFDLSALSKCLALSRSQLYRRLYPLIRQSPAHYIKFVRLQKAKELIDASDFSIGEIAFKTGFVSQSHFTRAFRAQYGFNPSEVRWRNKRELSVASHQPEIPAL